VYFAHVQSHLNYIAPILAAGRVQISMLLLPKQRKRIRVATTIFRYFEILSLAQLITYIIAFFMFDFLAKNLPESLLENGLLTETKLLLKMGESLETTTTFTFLY